MATKRFYWLKLEENFFKSNKIKILKKMNNGHAYLILYLEMMLNAINTDGMLLLDKDIPCDAETLSLLFDMEQKEVEDALSVFKKLGLIEIKDGVISITNFENLVGSETDAAKRMRQTRANKSEHCYTDSELCYIEIEKDKEIDKEIDIDTEGETEKKKIGTHNLAQHSQKNDFDNNSFIIPTSEEVALYAEERGNGIDSEKFYDHYTAVGWKIGNTPIRDWKAAFRKWEKSERPANASTAANKKSPGAYEKTKDHPWNGRRKEEDHDTKWLTEKSGSFDTDDFFEAALRRSYGDDYD